MFLLKDYGTAKTIDIRITHLSPQSYSNLSSKQIYQHHKKDNITITMELTNIEKSSFNHLVFTLVG